MSNIMQAAFDQAKNNLRVQRESDYTGRMSDLTLHYLNMTMKAIEEEDLDAALKHLDYARAFPVNSADRAEIREARYHLEDDIWFVAHRHLSDIIARAEARQG